MTISFLSFIVCLPNWQKAPIQRFHFYMKTFLGALVNTIRILKPLSPFSLPVLSCPQKEEMEGQGPDTWLGWLALQWATQRFVSWVWIYACWRLPLTSCKGIGHSVRKPQCPLHLEMPSSVCVGLVSPLKLLKTILYVALSICIVLFSAKLTHRWLWECARKDILFGALKLSIQSGFFSIVCLLKR